MMVALEELPDDPTLLKRFLIERDAAWRAEHDALIAERKTLIEQVKQQAITEREALREAMTAERKALIDRIKEEAAREMESLRQRLEAEHKAVVDALLRRYYGPRQEKFDPRQLLLFGLTVDQLPLNPSSVEDESGEKLVTRRVNNRHKHGRGQLPDHLERIEIEHDLADHEKACPACGQPRERIGAEVSEQLEYFPASFKVLKHVRHKYGCRRCDHDGYRPNIAAAAKPPQPIDRGLPGPSLLAHVITSKLGDHLPLYRLERIFARQQVDVARSTMCAWMRAAGEMVRPLVALMSERVKASRVIHTDDTPVPIRAPRHAARAASGATWATRPTRTWFTTTRPTARATARPRGCGTIAAICKRTRFRVTTASTRAAR